MSASGEENVRPEALLVTAPTIAEMTKLVMQNLFQLEQIRIDIALDPTLDGAITDTARFVQRYRGSEAEDYAEHVSSWHVLPPTDSRPGSENGVFLLFSWPGDEPGGVEVGIDHNTYIQTTPDTAEGSDEEIRISYASLEHVVAVSLGIAEDLKPVKIEKLIEVEQQGRSRPMNDEEHARSAMIEAITQSDDLDPNFMEELLGFVVPPEVMDRVLGEIVDNKIASENLQRELGMTLVTELEARRFIHLAKQALGGS